MNMTYFLNRLKEPSTYAGLAGLAVAIGLGDAAWAAISAIGVALFGALAVILPEIKKL
jgi:hypothetical protein